MTNGKKVATPYDLDGRIRYRPAAVIAILLNILIPKDKAAEPFRVE